MTAVVRLLPVHFPTHNNPAAQAESSGAVDGWLSRGPDAQLSTAIGDFNLEDHDLDYDLVLSTGKVDHGVTNDDVLATARRLSTPPGCHGWGLYYFELDGVRFTVLAANIESAVARPELARLIDLHHPDAVIVLQAYRARAWLRGIPGYQLWQYRGREASGIAVLLNPATVKLEKRRAVRMTRPWTGPKAGKKHRPRTYPSMRLTVGNRS